VDCSGAPFGGFAGEARQVFSAPSSRAEKAFRAGDAGGYVEARGRGRYVPRGQSFDLFDVEHGVTLEEVNVARDFDAADEAVRQSA
jgi:hypothetical protein